MNTPHRPIALIILDGWGYREDPKYNAINIAKTPVFDHLWKTCPHILVAASGSRVGLPEGQMGNSEVGHLNLGAGRVIYQDLLKISRAIESGEFFKNPVFINAIERTIKVDKALHIFGLLSCGGIHSHEKHIQAICQLASQKGAKKIYMHAFLDGRDTPPKSAEKYIHNLEKYFSELGVGKIATLIGRFYAMDRDKRWDRVEQAYDALTLGEAVRHAESAAKALYLAYAEGETDEFVKPSCIHSLSEDPITIKDGDSIIFMNFRADRAREITRAFTQPDFTEFTRKRVVSLTDYVALTEYDQTFKLPIAFAPGKLEELLGEVIAEHDLKQLRIAETEKYAHVTFFFNGGLEAPNKGEDRILIPSPKVETYDLQPEMHARELTSRLVKEIKSNKYDVIICNYANCDMLGHTGNMDATVTTVECVDECLKQVLAALKETGGEALITADHGNAELMFNPETQQPHTAHTKDKVPFIYVGRTATISNNDPALCDVAPTLLSLLNLPIPQEMTGKSIVGVV